MHNFQSSYPAFPRMNADDAAERVRKLSPLSLSEIRDQATTSLIGATFYQTASVRISSNDLDEIQEAVRILASEHGYPLAQARGRSIEFDRQLTTMLLSSLKILPADASEEGVWSFLTLNVLPEIALWRFPNTPGDGEEVRDNYERLVGKPRNVFRRAWWRGYILGPDYSTRLIEDEAVGIMERPSIGGSPRLARKVAEVHLQNVAREGAGSRQDLLREGIKRLRRRMGQISVHVLSDEQLHGLVVDSFTLRTNRSSETRIARAQSTIEKFRELVPTSWMTIADSATEVSWDRMSRLLDLLAIHKINNPENESVARKIAIDLERLVEGWDAFTADERSVVHAAVVYFLDTNDGIPDHLPNGLDDDDEVVSAAYSALNRVRE